jgi:hypothetical protein
MYQVRKTIYYDKYDHGIKIIYESIELIGALAAFILACRKDSSASLCVWDTDSLHVATFN